MDLLKFIQLTGLNRTDFETSRTENANSAKAGLPKYLIRALEVI